VRYLSLE
jgi:hypothetical protein